MGYFLTAYTNSTSQIDRTDQLELDTDAFYCHRHSNPSRLWVFGICYLDYQKNPQRRMERVSNSQWHFGFFILRLPREKMHNLTITLGLILCMSAGAITVAQETIPSNKQDAYRLFRTARRAGRKTKEYLIDLWN